MLAHSNWIIESHTISIIPKKAIDHVFILRVPSTSLYYDRLASRGYSKAKIDENMDCEIMQVVWQEAVETFDEEDCTVLKNETNKDLSEAIDEAVEVIKGINA